MHELRRFFDDWAPTYDSTPPHPSVPYVAPSRVAACVHPIRGCEDGGETRILDLGCGTGLVAAALHARRSALGDLALYGVDLSPASLAVAAGKGLYRALIEADAFSAGLHAAVRPTGPAFHYVVSVGLTEFLEVRDLGRWLSDIGRVAAPAVLVCTFPATPEAADVSCYSLDAILEACAACGLGLLGHSRYPAWHSEAHGVVVEYIQCEIQL